MALVISLTIRRPATRPSFDRILTSCLPSLAGKLLTPCQFYGRVGLLTTLIKADPTGNLCQICVFTQPTVQLAAISEAVTSLWLERTQDVQVLRPQPRVWPHEDRLRSFLLSSCICPTTMRQRRHLGHSQGGDGLSALLRRAASAHHEAG